MSGTEWRYEDGRWSAPVGDGTTCAEVYDDELETLPPLMEALDEVDQYKDQLADAYDVSHQLKREVGRLAAERDRLRAAIETHRGAIAFWSAATADRDLWAVLGEATDG